MSEQNTSEEMGFDQDLARLTQIQRASERNSDCDFLLGFIDKLWREYMRALDGDDFKNFHRLLCERFGYVHDEKDWQRDQLSLIEHIASRSLQTGDAREALRNVKEWLSDPRWGQWPYMESSQLYADKNKVLAVVRAALTKQPVKPNEADERIEFAIKELDALQTDCSTAKWVRDSVLSVLRGQITPDPSEVTP